jgi:hypothetical protein
MTKELLNIHEDESRQLKRRTFSQSTYRSGIHRDDSFQGDFVDYRNYLEIKKTNRSNPKSTRKLSLSSESNSTSTHLIKSANEIDNNNNLVNRKRLSSAHNNEEQHQHRTSSSSLISLKKENFFLQIFYFLKNQTQFLTLTLVVVISILINSIYFNFYYLPSLTHVNHQHQSLYKKNQLEKVEPRLPPLSFVNQDNLKKKTFKSYDHVVFPTIGSSNQPNSDHSQQTIEEDLGTNVKIDLFKQEAHLAASPVSFKNYLNEDKVGKDCLYFF